MKKLVTFILVLSLVLGLGTVAFADEYEDKSEVTINKTLTIVNQGTKNPSETFSFTVVEGSGERDGQSIPAPEFDQEDAAFEITIDAGETEASTDINLPDFTQVGVYTYTLKENPGTTAGMRYDSNEYYLVVTVINNPAFGEEGEPQFLRVLTLQGEGNLKEEGFENQFEAGSLTVHKVVTGNYGDPNDEFEVTVTLTPQGELELNDESIEALGADSYNQDAETGVITIVYTVMDGESFTINNIPYDVDYKVEETGYTDGYDPSYDGNESGEIDEPAQETTITNNRDIEIDTGINLDSMPYYAVLAIAIGGLAVFLIRRRLIINS